MQFGDVITVPLLRPIVVDWATMALPRPTATTFYVRSVSVPSSSVSIASSTVLTTCLARTIWAPLACRHEMPLPTWAQIVDPASVVPAPLPAARAHMTIQGDATAGTGWGSEVQLCHVEAPQLFRSPPAAALEAEQLVWQALIHHVAGSDSGACLEHETTPFAPLLKRSAHSLAVEPVPAPLGPDALVCVEEPVLPPWRGKGLYLTIERPEAATVSREEGPLMASIGASTSSCSPQTLPQHRREPRVEPQGSNWSQDTLLAHVATLYPVESPQLPSWRPPHHQRGMGLHHSTFVEGGPGCATSVPLHGLTTLVNANDLRRVQRWLAVDLRPVDPTVVPIPWPDLEPWRANVSWADSASGLYTCPIHQWHALLPKLVLAQECRALLPMPHLFGQSDEWHRGGPPFQPWSLTAGCLPKTWDSLLESRSYPSAAELPPFLTDKKERAIALVQLREDDLFLSQLSQQALPQASVNEAMLLFLSQCNTLPTLPQLRNAYCFSAWARPSLGFCVLDGLVASCPRPPSRNRRPNVPVITRHSPQDTTLHALAGSSVAPKLAPQKRAAVHSSVQPSPHKRVRSQGVEGGGCVDTMQAVAPSDTCTMRNPSTPPPEPTTEVGGNALAVAVATQSSCCDTAPPAEDGAVEEATPEGNASIVVLEVPSVAVRDSMKDEPTGVEPFPSAPISMADNVDAWMQLRSTKPVPAQGSAWQPVVQWEADAAALLCNGVWLLVPPSPGFGGVVLLRCDSWMQAHQGARILVVVPSLVCSRALVAAAQLRLDPPTEHNPCLAWSDPAPVLPETGCVVVVPLAQVPHVLTAWSHVKWSHVLGFAWNRGAPTWQDCALQAPVMDALYSLTHAAETTVTAVVSQFPAQGPDQAAETFRLWNLHSVCHASMNDSLWTQQDALLHRMVVELPEPFHVISHRLEKAWSERHPMHPLSLFPRRLLRASSFGDALDTGIAKAYDLIACGQLDIEAALKQVPLSPNVCDQVMAWIRGGNESPPPLPPPLSSPTGDEGVEVLWITCVCEWISERCMIHGEKVVIVFANIVAVQDCLYAVQSRFRISVDVIDQRHDPSTTAAATAVSALATALATAQCVFLVLPATNVSVVSPIVGQPSTAVSSVLIVFCQVDALPASEAAALLQSSHSSPTLYSLVSTLQEASHASLLSHRMGKAVLQWHEQHEGATCCDATVFDGLWSDLSPTEACWMGSLRALQGSHPSACIKRSLPSNIRLKLICSRAFLERFPALGLKKAYHWITRTRLLVDICIDERNCMLFRDREEVTKDATVRQLFGLGLRYEHCWLVVLSMDALPAETAVVALYQMEHVHILFGDTEALVEDCIQLCSRRAHANSLLQKDIKLWMTREWLCEEESMHERFLTSFLPVNAFSAQVILNVLPLQVVMGLAARQREDSLCSRLPWLRPSTLRNLVAMWSHRAPSVPPIDPSQRMPQPPTLAVAVPVRVPSTAARETVPLPGPRVQPKRDPTPPPVLPVHPDGYYDMSSDEEHEEEAASGLGDEANPGQSGARSSSHNDVAPPPNVSPASRHRQLVQRWPNTNGFRPDHRPLGVRVVKGSRQTRIQWDAPVAVAKKSPFFDDGHRGRRRSRSRGRGSGLRRGRDRAFPGADNRVTKKRS